MCFRSTGAKAPLAMVSDDAIQTLDNQELNYRGVWGAEPPNNLPKHPPKRSVLGFGVPLGLPNRAFEPSLGTPLGAPLGEPLGDPKGAPNGVPVWGPL